MSSIPKVTVCLATYNGGDFLREQIESLLSQKNIDVSIIAGDDGSEDNTLEILDEYLSAGLISKVLFFDRIGSTGNFASLVQECANVEFVAFADQDDIWDVDKLGILISEFSGKEPQLVFCGRDILGDSTEIPVTLLTSGKRLGFKNALIESSVPGNTIVINKQAIDIVNKSLISQVKYFDAYLYLLLSAFGRVFYVDKPLVRYRIHSKNQVGLGKKGITEKLESIANYIRTAEIFESDFGNILTAEKRQVLNKFLNSFRSSNFLQSAIQILKSPVQRQKRAETLGWKILAVVLRLRKTNYLSSSIERK